MKKHTPKQLTALALAGVFFLAGCAGGSGNGPTPVPEPSSSAPASPSPSKSADRFPEAVTSDVPASASEAVELGKTTVRNYTEILDEIGRDKSRFGKDAEAAIKRYTMDPYQTEEITYSKELEQRGHQAKGHVKVTFPNVTPVYQVLDDDSRELGGATVHACLDYSEIFWKDGDGKDLVRPPVMKRKATYHILRDPKTSEWKIRVFELPGGETGNGEPC